jgi:hypothetical protein
MGSGAKSRFFICPNGAPEVGLMGGVLETALGSDYRMPHILRSRMSAIVLSPELRRYRRRNLLLQNDINRVARKKRVTKTRTFVVSLMGGAGFEPATSTV